MTAGPYYVRLLGDIDPRLRARTFLVVAWEDGGFFIVTYGRFPLWFCPQSERGKTWELAEHP